MVQECCPPGLYFGPMPLTGWWTGLDPMILATRDIGIQEIYALHTRFP